MTIFTTLAFYITLHDLNIYFVSSNYVLLYDET